MATARILNSPDFAIIINGKDYSKYFSRQADQFKLLAPITLLGDLIPKMSFFLKVYGGGTTGQSVACSNAIAKCIAKEFGDDDGIRKILRKEGCLTRDPRVVERKKAGLRKARKREQWSKR